MSIERIIWSEPIREVLREMEAEAEAIEHSMNAEASHAVLIRKTIQRMEAAIERGAELEYVDTALAAECLRIGEEAVRARCRRKLAREGLARKRGGDWEIHRSVLEAAA